MLEQLMQNINDLWKLFLRPSRQVYTAMDLGPDKFLIANQSFIRKDFSIRNRNGLLLQASWFCPLKSYQRRPFVIYCHCNSGSRVEALPYAKTLLSNGFGLCCFDFSGSGCSEGDYVTLGYNETDDLQIIVTMLRESNLAEEIFIWGRSMGAVTALNYILKYKDSKISGLILDSPYCNLRNLALELGQNSIKLPKFMLNPIIDSIEKKIKKRARFNLNMMNLIPLFKMQENLNTPAFFITSLKDKVVAPYHVEELKKLWGKEATLKYIDLEHYENRGDKIVDECINFLKSHMKGRKRSNSFSNNAQIKCIPIPNEILLKPVNRIKMYRK